MYDLLSSGARGFKRADLFSNVSVSVVSIERTPLLLVLVTRLAKLLRADLWE